MGRYPSSLTGANVNSGNTKKGGKNPTLNLKNPAGCLRGFVIQYRDFNF